MSPVAAHVKQSMLEYASIFPTRLKVLVHDFIVLGNGKEWLADGTIGCDYETPKVFEGPIYVDDIDDMIKLVKSFSDKRDGDLTDTQIKQIARYEAERAERLERAANIDYLADLVDPKGVTTGHYGDLANIINDVVPNQWRTTPYLNIWNVPQNVEASWWAAANEVVEAAIRGSNNLDARAHMRVLWEAMTNYVEGRTETFVMPPRPETHAERLARQNAIQALRTEAFDQVAVIERVLNRAGYTLDMKAERRSKSHASNGSYSQIKYEVRAMDEDAINKLDRALVKQGYTRTDDDRPTWENGKEHRVAVRLFPFDEGQYMARIVIFGTPADEHSKDAKHRAWFAAGQKAFDEADRGSNYVAPPPVVVAASPAPRTLYQVVPGSLQVDGTILTAGVHNGASEWDIKNVRYLRADLSLITDKNRTMIDILSEVYDNSVGCMVNGGFKLI